jgi:alanyl-tRNA synthetase
MKTVPLYFADNYLFEGSAEVLFTGQDEKGAFIVVDKTLFYPQGGGQPFDLGQIDRFEIVAVRWIEDEIRHYTSQNPTALLGKTVTLLVDSQRRMQNSSCHTAGHLLSHIVEAHHPHLKGIKGHHYQDAAYVEFTGTNLAQIDLELLNQALAKAIESNHKITLRNEAAKHFVQIGPYPAYACGGTHVKMLEELVSVRSIKQKLTGNILRISYTVDTLGAVKK